MTLICLKKESEVASLTVSRSILKRRRRRRKKKQYVQVFSSSDQSTSEDLTNNRCSTLFFGRSSREKTINIWQSETREYSSPTIPH